MLRPDRLHDFANIIENNEINIAIVMAGFIYPNMESALVRPARLQPEDFDCQTAACLAGNAVICAYGLHDAITRHRADCSFEAARIFGLSFEQKSKLFFPNTDDTGSVSYSTQGNDFFTRSRVARVLRHLADTGLVNWSI